MPELAAPLGEGVPERGPGRGLEDPPPEAARRPLSISRVSSFAPWGPAARLGAAARRAVAPCPAPASPPVPTPEPADKDSLRFPIGQIKVSAKTDRGSSAIKHVRMH